MIYFDHFSSQIEQHLSTVMLSGIGRSEDLSSFGIETVVDLPDVEQNLQV